MVSYHKMKYLKEKNQRPNSGFISGSSTDESLFLDIVLKIFFFVKYTLQGRHSRIPTQLVSEGFLRPLNRFFLLHNRG